LYARLMVRRSPCQQLRCVVVMVATVAVCTLDTCAAVSLLVSGHAHADADSGVAATHHLHRGHDTRKPPTLLPLPPLPRACRLCGAVVEASGMLELSKAREQDRARTHAQCLADDATNPAFSQCMSSRVEQSLRRVHGTLCDRDDFRAQHGPHVVHACQRVVGDHLPLLTKQWKRHAMHLTPAALYTAQRRVCGRVSKECLRRCVLRVDTHRMCVVVCASRSLCVVRWLVACVN